MNDMSANGISPEEVWTEEKEQETDLSEVDIEDIFCKYLPIRLTAIKRLYVAYIRKAYELWTINHTTTIELCKLIKSLEFIENSFEWKIFLNILEIFSTTKKINTSEKKFLKELTEWMFVWVLWKETAELLQKIITSSEKELTNEDIEFIREEYSIRASNIVNEVIKQRLLLDFRSIPVEIIPFFSEEVRKFIFQISRKNYWIEEKVYDTRMISYEQNEVLRRSLHM